MSRRLFAGRAISTFLGAGLLSLAVALPAAAQSSGPSLVVLVRHGEKAAEPANDPVLSAAGQERAKALAEAMANMAPSAIITSATKRTNETAAVLAAKYGVAPQIVSMAGGGAAHIAAVASAVRAKSGVVVVVGHSNTVPAIIKALGGPALADLCDASYATFFVLQPSADGKTASVLRSSYGTPDAPGATGCAAMPAR